jgi:hypothetical protein
MSDRRLMIKVTRGDTMSGIHAYRAHAAGQARDIASAGLRGIARGVARGAVVCSAWVDVLAIAVAPEQRVPR